MCQRLQPAPVHLGGGQHLGAVVLDVLHRGNRVIIRSMRPPGQAGASLAFRRSKNANLPRGASDARRSCRIARPVRRPCARYVFRAAERDRPRSAKPQVAVATEGQQGQAAARHVLLELELDQEGVARGTRRDRTSRSSRSRSHCSCRPHLLRAGPPRPDAPDVPTMPASARPGTFDGSARRRSRLSASRVSVALRASCTSRC